MQRTRRQILDCIKLRGPMSVDQLGEILEVMPVTVRAHVNVLERDHLLEGAEHRSGRAGRPSIIYSLTERAQDLFPKDYDNLASSLLNHVRKLHGEDTVARLVTQIGEDMALANVQHIRSEDMDGKVEEATQIMNGRGFLATWEREGGKYVLIAHNCPYIHVTEHCPEICTMELTFLRKVLATEVKLQSSVADGANSCRFHIPVAAGAVEGGQAAIPEP